jgi:hypothetical protein
MKTKKLILLLITLTTFMNVSYAAFPITETEQTEHVEISANIIESPRYDFSWIVSLLSPIMAVLSFFFVLLIFGGAMGGSPDSVLENFFIFYLISAIAAVALGVISVIKKSKAYALGIIGALLGLLSLSLMLGG